MDSLASTARLHAVRVNRPVARLDLRAVPVLVGAVVAVGGFKALAERQPLKPRPVTLLRWSAALLGLAVLADSAMEHYRGSFRDPAMVAPLASSALLVGAELHGLVTGGQPLGGLRRAGHVIALGVGGAGLGFHLYNVGSRPGGYDWLNFFYAAPLGAPAALSLAGLIGGAADVLDARPRSSLAGLPPGTALAALTSIGLLGTSAEAGFLHFRGAYHNPFMWLPASLPPVASAILASAALRPKGGHALARGWMWATAVLGLAGSLFHAYGISRNMGGWRNWRQNLLAGPPLPAPPSFSALALAGIAALEVL